jgi:hypothetical protein
MTTLPMELSLASPKPWLTCLALGVTHATAVSIAQLVSELVLPVGTMLQTDPSMLHLSLYRGFGISEALQEQIEKMGSELLRTPSFGTVCGLRVAVKKCGIYYGYDASSCRTVY